MLKPNKYKKFYKDIKLFQKESDVATAIIFVNNATSKLSFRKKIYVFFRVLFG